MTLRYFLSGVELTNVNVTGRPRAGALDGLVSAAYSGDIGSSGIVIDDPSGAVTIKGWQPFYVTEDACTPSRIWTGYIMARRISRSDMNPDGVGRVWDCDLVDLNVLLGLRILRGSAAKRPAETDVARVQWLLTTAFMTGAGSGIYDNGFVLTGSPHPYDGADYRKQRPAEVISSVMGLTKIGFVYWDEAAGQASLYYGRHSIAMGDLTVKLSNHAADIDDANPSTQTTFVALDGQEIMRNPEDVGDGLYFDWRGADIYRQRAATYADFGIHRDSLYSTERVGSPITASSQTDSILVARSVERDTITCTVHLRANQVNWFREGFRVQVKFTHLPGYESYVWTTIQRRTVRQAPDAIDRYDVQLELTTAAPESGPGGGDPGSFPHIPCSAGASALVQSAYATSNALSTVVTLGAAPTVGNVLAVWVSFRGNGGPYSVTGFTDITGEINPGIFNGQRGRMYYRIVQAGDPSTVTLSGGNVGIGTTMVVVELAGVDALETFGNNGDVTTQPATMTLGTVAPSAGKQMILLGGVVAGLGDPDTFSAVPVGSAVEIRDLDTTGADTWAGYQIVASSTGSYSMAITPTHGGIMFGYAGALAAFICSGSDNPPTPGQWFYDVVPTPVADGTTKTFTLPVGREFADGSLIVKVDRLDQTAAVTAYDGALRTFTLAFAPKIGELIEVSGQGR